MLQNNIFGLNIINRIKRAIRCKRRQINQKKFEGFNSSEFYNNPERFEKVWFASQYGYKPNFKKPADINQLLLKINIESFQDKRLHEIRVKCADKYLVRNYVKSKGLEQILVPLLGVYDNIDDVNWDALPDQFVIKTNFACGQNYICKDKKLCNLEAVKAQFRDWMNISDFGLSTGEWHYCEIPHKIIIEQLLKSSETESITDYKFQCFNGKVYGCFVASDRTINGANFTHYDRNWKLTSGIKSEFNKKNTPVIKPVNLERMVEIAEKLSSGMPYCRIDLYSIENDIFFGEMTFTPAANIMGYYEEWILKDMLSFYQLTQK